MKIFALVFVAILFHISTASACLTDYIPSGGVFSQICYTYGEADLHFYSDSVRGTIGGKEVELAYYENFVYGQTDFLDIKMTVHVNGLVDVTSGNAKFQLEYANGRIFGCVPCLGPASLSGKTPE